MTSRLDALCIDAHEPGALARFWEGVLGWQPSENAGVGVLVTDADASFPLRFVPSAAQKSGPNRMHFDLTSTTLADQRETVRRARRLGACHIDVGQRPEEGHVVLADPEGNEFCVIEPGNGFLAGCGSLGALACDGSQEVGYFWSRALAWPLVWDRDQETAIQSPGGGTKISWGGAPINPKAGPNRLRFELAVEDHLEGELRRLLALGAAPLNSSAGTRLLADPDGNEFTVVALP